MKTIVYLVIFSFPGWANGIQDRSGAHEMLKLENLAGIGLGSEFSMQIPTRYQMDAPVMASDAMKLASLTLPAAVSGSSSGDDGDLPFKPPKPEVAWRKPVGWTALAVGAVALVVGGYLYVKSWDDEVRQGDSLQSYTIASFSLLGVGAASALGGYVLLSWKDYAPVVEATEERTTLSIQGKF